MNIEEYLKWEKFFEPYLNNKSRTISNNLIKKSLLPIRENYYETEGKLSINSNDFCEFTQNLRKFSSKRSEVVESKQISENFIDNYSPYDEMTSSKKIKSFTLTYDKIIEQDNNKKGENDENDDEINDEKLLNEMEKINKIEKNRQKFISLLKNGYIFLKYSKFSKPKEKYIKIDNEEKFLIYRKINQKKGKEYLIDDIIDIIEGRNHKFFSKNEDAIENSFILKFTKSRVLALEAQNSKIKKKLIETLKILKKMEK